MAKIDLHKQLLRNQGIDLDAGITPEQWLELAIKNEHMLKLCGPFDPVYEHLSRMQRIYEKAMYIAAGIVP